MGLKRVTPNADRHIDRIVTQLPDLVRDLPQLFNSVEKSKETLALQLGFLSWMDFTTWLRADDLRAEAYMQEMSDHSQALDELFEDGQFTREEFNIERHSAFLRGYKAGFEDSWEAGKRI